MFLSPILVAAGPNGPAMMPPPGVTPEFDGPKNENPLAWGVMITCTIITAICVFLRLYVRTWWERRLHKEEVLTLLSFAAFLGTAYSGYSFTWSPGYYVHQWDLRIRDLPEAYSLILLYSSFYSVSLPLVKTAILLDWSRVLVVSERRSNPFWWACIVLSAIQCIWGTICTILINLNCSSGPNTPKCFDLSEVMLISSIVQVVTSFAMVVLPQRIIWNLRLTWRKKLGVSVIFGVGLIACGAACFRLIETVRYTREEDHTYYISPLFFWTWGELTAGFFVLCVPSVAKMAAETQLPGRIRRSLGRSCNGNKQSDAEAGMGEEKGNGTVLVTIGGGSETSKNRLSRLVTESTQQLRGGKETAVSGSPEGDSNGTRYGRDRGGRERGSRDGGSTRSDARGSGGIVVTRETKVTVEPDPIKEGWFKGRCDVTTKRPWENVPKRERS
ncbi:hypothetical protein RB594_001206 [Gaeumannomyces avenae]